MGLGCLKSCHRIPQDPSVTDATLLPFAEQGQVRSGRGSGRSAISRACAAQLASGTDRKQGGSRMKRPAFAVVAATVAALAIAACGSTKPAAQTATTSKPITAAWIY